MKKVLSSRFFNQDTLVVAEKLVGKYLVIKQRGKVKAYRITEVEAYDGPTDQASHASRGETPRNKVMFGPAGYFYLYLVYGCHQMLNIVTGQKGYPAAILIRALNNISGPGRVTKTLDLDQGFNHKPATVKTGLWFEDRGEKILATQIKRLPRVGVAYAGPIWSQKKYRFKLVTDE